MEEAAAYEEVEDEGMKYETKILGMCLGTSWALHVMICWFHDILTLLSGDLGVQSWEGSLYALVLNRIGLRLLWAWVSFNVEGCGIKTCMIGFGFGEFFKMQDASYGEKINGSEFDKLQATEKIILNL